LIVAVRGSGSSGHAQINDQVFTVAAARFWNMLSCDIADAPSFPVFNRRLYNILLCAVVSDVTSFFLVSLLICVV
jgi:hypothetical protein